VLLLWLGVMGTHYRASWTIGSVAAFLLLSVLIGWLPLRWALRRLDNLEA
jgi:hypothetical protein